MVRLSFKQLALRVFGFCPAGSTWHGKFVLRKDCNLEHVRIHTSFSV